MKKLLTLMVGLGLALGTVGAAFAADEKPATTEKKKEKKEKKEKKAGDTSAPAKPSK